MRSNKTDPMISQKSESAKGGKSDRGAYKRKAYKPIDVALISNKELTAYVGGMVKRIRQMSDYTQTELAERIVCMSRDTIVRCESGKNRSMTDLTRIAAALDVPVYLFFPSKAVKLQETSERLQNEIDSIALGATASRTNTLGQALWNKLNQCKYTQDQIAECIGITPVTYWRWHQDKSVDVDDYVVIYQLTQIAGMDMMTLYPSERLSRHALAIKTYLEIKNAE